MSQEKEVFLARWSRLKTESRAPNDPPPPAAPETAQAPVKDEGAPPPLPKVDELTPDSDFRPFMDARVDPDTRRAALKKLFADAHFNVPDPFEAYSEDYTKGETLSPELLKKLNQARRLLFDEAEKAAQAPADQAPEPPPQEAKDDAARQDS